MRIGPPFCVAFFSGGNEACVVVFVVQAVINSLTCPVNFSREEIGTGLNSDWEVIIGAE